MVVSQDLESISINMFLFSRNVHHEICDSCVIDLHMARRWTLTHMSLCKCAWYGVAGVIWSSVAHILTH